LAITSDLIRGHTETIILAHLYGSESYGYEVNKSIFEKSAGRYELKEATLYGAFRRLEETGCISSYWGDEATGARRRYYRITEKGKQQLRDNTAEWGDAKNLIDTLIKFEEGTN
jgi:DNA-binding PadR family transcriptional regulator